MTTPARSAPRMADVAARAGVSHQTVSRVLNGSPNVRPATRDLVMRAIDDLGYRRNSSARALATRRSGVVGVVVADLGYFGPSSTVIGVEAAARAAGYSTILASLPDDSGAAVRAALEHLASVAAEAIVLVAPHETDVELGPTSGFPVPVIVLDGDPARVTLSIGVDQHAGAVLATQHLLDLGHRHVAHLRGPLSWSQADARHRGWATTLEKAGLEVPACLVGDWSAASGYALGRELVEDRDLTAVFAANDQMALGLMRALAEAGRRVGSDVSIVGFDDIPEAGYLTPPLTTVRQDFAALGQEAMRMLLGTLGRRPVPSRLVPPKLVVRSSTGRPGPARPGARPATDP